MADTEHHGCGSCVHWRRLPANPQNLKQVLGQCLESPPHPIVAISPHGPVVMGAQYPLLPPDHLPCSRLVLRLITDRVGVVTENGR